MTKKIFALGKLYRYVIPAQAGIQDSYDHLTQIHWIPACAGMT